DGRDRGRHRARALATARRPGDRRARGGTPRDVPRPRPPGRAPLDPRRAEARGPALRLGRPAPARHERRRPGRAGLRRPLLLLPPPRDVPARGRRRHRRRPGPRRGVLRPPGPPLRAAEPGLVGRPDRRPEGHRARCHTAVTTATEASATDTTPMDTV